MIRFFRISVFFFGVVFASHSFADVISERQAEFKASSVSIKAIIAAIPDADTATIAEEAAKIGAWSMRLTTYFPEGSNTGDTKALPEIWSQFDEFSRIADNSAQAALELASLAQQGGADSEALTAALRKLGSTCNGCHEKFRKK